MYRKGVCYDVGRVMMGGNWRPKFDPKTFHGELTIIKDDLHCNSVRICGFDEDRLASAAEDALAQGLEVWLSPEMWDRRPDETLQYIVRAATRAEELRQRWPGKLVLSLGSELTLFMKGIVEGDNFFERLNNPAFWEIVRTGRHNASLNDFLGKSAKSVREVFHGQITYFSVPLEQVDWGPLDFVGVDFYRDSRIRDAYGEMVKSYKQHGKPVVIGEFGCCTYTGAEKLGGNGFMVVFGMMEQLLNPKIALPPTVAEMIKVIPQADGHYIRDEGLQARELADQLEVLDNAGVEGAFVFTFVSPNSPVNADPRFDSDLGSFSLVKSYPEGETADEFARQASRQGKLMLGVDLDTKLLERLYTDVGRHGKAFPEMPWDPKESFYAVSSYYLNH
ncbi:MAG TPA: hypothetical protein VEJ36_06445 [Nitrososphaerales archaeon]|nr:hypothetical protein [Nitrososphaerales archaeon]